MIKKVLVLLILSTFASLVIKAQNNGEVSYYSVVNGKDMPEAAQTLLKTKMEQIAAKQGYGSANRADRFLFVAKCNVVEKDIAPTTPPRIRQETEITFLLGDAVENKVYASESFNLKGIGTNETKAWQTAINSLKVDNPSFSKLFTEAKGKIESYYRANCQGIISKARTLASTGKFEEAIALLMGVPDICDDCHQTALDEAGSIYQQKIDKEGLQLLSRARNVWSANMDQKGAHEALQYINSIDSNSEAFTRAEQLTKEMSAKLSSDKAREWEQKIKQHNDEMALRRRKQADSHAREMASIAAYRSVAEKWAENQPETKIYLNW